MQTYTSSTSAMVIFECFAMDADHAAEQALDAYPSGQVHHAWQVH